ncbi:MAG TPA: hypothetical protein VFB51_01980 [Solirubrobacterales bacterium]|nr:hypothetical protein [Solirubrobacterales bacterium]
MEDLQAGFSTAVLDWEEGYRRVQATRGDAHRDRMLGRVVTAVQDELRKRLGSRFSVTELVDLYRERGDVLCDVGMVALPPGSDLTDVSAACDAAFYLYMREAQDFAGGRPMRALR